MPVVRKSLSEGCKEKTPFDRMKTARGSSADQTQKTGTPGVLTTNIT